jgi:hypothetical protein
MDDVNGALIIAEIYSRLEEFRSYQKYIGKTMDYVYEELQGYLNRILEETDYLGGG